MLEPRRNKSKTDGALAHLFETLRVTFTGLEAATNLVLTPLRQARIAVYSSSEDGYVEDAFGSSRSDLFGHNKADETHAT